MNTLVIEPGVSETNTAPMETFRRDLTKANPGPHGIISKGAGLVWSKGYGTPAALATQDDGTRLRENLRRRLAPVRVEGNRICVNEEAMLPQVAYTVTFRGSMYQFLKEGANRPVVMYELIAQQ